MTPPHNLLIAGDASLRKNLAEQFGAVPDFALFEAQSLTEATELARTETPDILILDEGLAEPDPHAVIAQLRSAGFNGQLLLLTANRCEFRAGLAECLIRPFRFADLVSRLRALLRPPEKRSDETIMIGPYVFRPASGDLAKVGGERVRLTERETAILARLARAKGASVSRDLLLRDVWGYSPEVATRTLETHVYRVRRKIEADPIKPSILITDANGYKLAAGDQKQGP
jgi:DNA-binding response OmpR family regulator